MAARQDTPARIKSSFPGYENLIDLAYGSDPTFRELCDDYRRCAAVLQKWRRQNGSETSPRSEEYAELLVELADEVKTWLDAMKGGST